MGLKVAKFGGSSVANAEQLKKVKAIVDRDSDRRVVVVSAPGKRFSGDCKITDLLYLTHAHIKYSAPYDLTFKLITERYNDIVKELGLGIDIHKFLEDINNRLKQEISIDYLVSRGEYLNALITAEYLGYKFVDAKDIIFIDEYGNVDFDKTNFAVNEIMKDADIKGIVVPGFYGSDNYDRVRTFSRGGSDITGAILSKALSADIYENWTDVSGLLMADPRIVENPRRIKSISYKELRELAYMGATVLHDEAVFPARDGGIPINIRNTNEPDNHGTYITNNEDYNEEDKQITGIAGKKGFTVITIYKSYLHTTNDFLKEVLTILDMNGVGVEHIPSGIDSVSLVVSKPEEEYRFTTAIREIRQKCRPDSINIYDNISLIATVGKNMAYTPGMAAKLFAALAKEDINIRMIDQGASEINIIVGIEDKDFSKGIKAIYKEFVK